MERAVTTVVPMPKPVTQSGFQMRRILASLHRVPADQAQTNQRAELSAIHRAVVILDARGYQGDDIKIYTDSRV
jgi:ribonuclease HI